MRLLLFSDVHGDLDACRSLVNRSSEADVVVGAGDFCRMRRNLQAPIDVLSDIETPTVLVPGNAESEDELKEACRDWPASHVLHGSGVTIRDVPFYGIGGGIPITPFGPWSYDVSESDAEQMLADCPESGVLVSHSPPKNAADRDSAGKHLGSTAVRAAIEEKKPLLTVCGHIHGSWGETAEVGPTTVVNAGPDGLFWDVSVPSSA